VSLLRALAVMVVAAVAVVLQVSLFPYLAWRGVGPDLVLLVVVGAALVRGARFACVLGFAAGLLIDLAPPADHLAGRWALAFVVVGYLVGRILQEAPGQPKPGLPMMVLVAGAASFVGTSVYALSGLLLKDPVVGLPQMLVTIGVAILWDVLLAVVVLPLAVVLFDRLRPDRLRPDRLRPDRLRPDRVRPDRVRPDRVAY
jgi:rod shape-determining protein MreD